MSAVFAGPGDDAWTAMAAWRVVAEALRLGGLGGRPGRAGTDRPRCRSIRHGRGRWSARPPARATASAGPTGSQSVGVVGELHPSVVAAFGLLGTDGRPRRVGWLDLDLDVLLDRDRVARRSETARPVSRYPSADIDLALVVDEAVPAAAVAPTLERAVGELCESVELFDVYRGPGIADGRRSLAFHLRFAALDHTLTDEEIAEVRARCIDAVASEHGATLRQ